MLEQKKKNQNRNTKEHANGHQLCFKKICKLSFKLWFSLLFLRVLGFFPKKIEIDQFAFFPRINIRNNLVNECLLQSAKELFLNLNVGYKCMLKYTLYSMSYLHAELSVKGGFLNQQKEKGKHL